MTSPSNSHLASDSSPVPVTVGAGAPPPSARRADTPAKPGGDGGEVRLTDSTAMPLAAEISEPDPCNPRGLQRPLWVVP